MYFCIKYEDSMIRGMYACMYEVWLSTDEDTDNDDM